MDCENNIPLYKHSNHILRVRNHINLQYLILKKEKLKAHALFEIEVRRSKKFHLSYRR